MGNCTFVIKTVGPHTNTPPIDDDAEKILPDLVRELMKRGHNVVSASLTYGGEHEVDVAAVTIDESKVDDLSVAPTPPPAATAPK